MFELWMALVQFCSQNSGLFFRKALRTDPRAIFISRYPNNCIRTLHARPILDSGRSRHWGKHVSQLTTGRHPTGLNRGSQSQRNALIGSPPETVASKG